MTCEEFLDLLDGGEELSPEALAHIDACPRCAAAYRRASEVCRGLDALKEDEAPPDLHGRLMAAIPAEKPRRPAFRRAWALPVAALFLAALLGGFSLLTFLRREPSEALPLPRPSVAAPHPAIEKKAEAPAEPKGRSLEDNSLSAAPPEEALPPPPSRPLELHREPPLTLSEDLREVRPAGSEGQRLQRQPAADETTPAPQGNLFAEEPPLSAGAAPVPAAPAAPSESEASPSLVLCAMETLDRSRYASLQLPPDRCPPRGSHWYVTLGEKGVTEVTDGKGRAILDAAQEVDAAARYLHLPPGRYKLRRVG